MTDTLNLVDVDFDLIVATDLFDAVACNWDAVGQPECTGTARWSYVCPGGCGYVWLHCNPHRDENDADLAEWASRPGHDRIFCTRCKASLPVPFPWTAI